MSWPRQSFEVLSHCGSSNRFVAGCSGSIQGNSDPKIWSCDLIRTLVRNPEEKCGFWTWPLDGQAIVEVREAD